MLNEGRLFQSNKSRKSDELSTFNKLCLLETSHEPERRPPSSTTNIAFSTKCFRNVTPIIPSHVRRYGEFKRLQAHGKGNSSSTVLLLRTYYHARPSLPFEETLMRYIPRRPYLLHKIIRRPRECNKNTACKLDGPVILYV